MSAETFEKVCLTLFVVCLTIIDILAHFNIWFSWSDDMDKVAIGVFNAVGIYIVYLVWRYEK